MQLSPEQLAGGARLWQYKRGQMAWGGVTFSSSTQYPWPVDAVYDGRPWTAGPKSRPCEITNPRPDLTDPATADGLPRSVRAAWSDSVYVYPEAERSCTRWLVRCAGNRFFDGDAFRPLRDIVAGNLWKFYATETEAWIAALLAAPEAM